MGWRCELLEFNKYNRTEGYSRLQIFLGNNWIIAKNDDESWHFSSLHDAISGI